MNAEIERRRTFAIIAHPDAGKTSLTEKLLLLVDRFRWLELLSRIKLRKLRHPTGWTSKSNVVYLLQPL